MTSGTSLDDLYKEDSRISPLFLRYWQIHEIPIYYISINISDKIGLESEITLGLSPLQFDLLSFEVSLSYPIFSRKPNEIFRD